MGRPNPRVSRDMPVGTDVNGINNDKYIQKVSACLRENLMNILNFSSAWQEWLIVHPDRLPQIEFIDESDAGPEKLRKLREALDRHVKLNSELEDKQRRAIETMLLTINEQLLRIQE